MRVTIVCLLLSIQVSVPGQNFHDNNCVYAVEGMVTDGISYEVIKHAIIKNEELGITTLSDDRGYYSLVFPLKYLDSSKIIGFEVFKVGYKINKWWVGYNPSDSVLNNSTGNCLLWNYDLKMIKLSRKNTNDDFNVTAHVRIDTTEHGFTGIKTSFEYFVKRSKKNDQLKMLKSNNEKVLFKLNGRYIISTNSSSIFLNNKKVQVYVNNKKVKLKHVNKLLTRSKTIENLENRDKYYNIHKNSKRWVFYLEERK